MVQELVARPPILVVGVDAFGGSVCAGLALTLQESAPERLETVQLLGPAEANDEQISAAVLALGVSQEDIQYAQLLVWVIADLTDLGTDQATPRKVLRSVQLAGERYNLQIFPRAVWQVGDLIRHGNGATAAARLRDLAAAVPGLSGVVVSGTSEGGPVCDDAAELILAVTTALEPIILMENWGPLANHPVLRTGPFAIFDGRLSQHPADQIAAWIAARLTLHVFSALSTDEPGTPLSLSWETVRLGESDVRAPAWKPIQPRLFESHLSLLHRVSLMRVDRLHDLDQWIGQTSQEVRGVSDKGLDLARRTYESSMAAFKSAVSGELETETHGVGRAARVSLAGVTAATGAVQGEHPASLPSLPVLDTGLFQAELDKLERLALRQSDPPALLLYGVVAFLCMLAGLWYPATNAIGILPGVLLSAGAALLLSAGTVLVYGFMRRNALREALSDHSPTARAYEALVNPWLAQIGVLKAAVADRWRLRSERQSGARFELVHGRLHRAALLLKDRIAELDSTPATAEELATQISVGVRFRRSLLLTDETERLAQTALIDHMERFGNTHADAAGNQAGWFGERPEDAVARLEQWIRNGCRDISTNNTGVDKAVMIRELDRLTKRARGLMALSPAVAGRSGGSYTLQVVPRALAGAAGDAPEGGQVLRYSLASLNKVYVLKLWTGLQAAQLQLETDLPSVAAP